MPSWLIVWAKSLIESYSLNERDGWWFTAGNRFTNLKMKAIYKLSLHKCILFSDIYITITWTKLVKLIETQGCQKRPEFTIQFSSDPVTNYHQTSLLILPLWLLQQMQINTLEFKKPLSKLTSIRLCFWCCTLSVTAIRTPTTCHIDKKNTTEKLDEWHHG